MADVSKISVALTTEMNELVQAAVASVEYATGSETLRQHEHAALRLLWAEGLNSGPGRLGGMDEIKREARRRLEATSPPTD